MTIVSPALAAVEPGIHFSPESARIGDPVTMHSASDYIICFVPPSGDEEHILPPDDSAYLAPATIATPSEDDLIPLTGSWSWANERMEFHFTVPRLLAARYRGYVDCPDGRLEPSLSTLQVIGIGPATDSIAAPTSPLPPWPAAVFAGLAAFVLALRMSRLTDR